MDYPFPKLPYRENQALTVLLVVLRLIQWWDRRQTSDEVRRLFFLLAFVGPHPVVVSVEFDAFRVGN